MITIAQAYAQFLEIMPAIDDEVAMREAWNNYTDSLTKDGELTGLQYHYCPAYGETMPDDDIESDILHILDGMGVTFTCKSIRFRSDGLCESMDRHWLCGINRGSRSMCVEYSQGSASKNPPTLLDVLSCCLSDFVDAKIFEESEFEWWGGELGYDTDSRKAEAIYRAVIAQSCDMRETFNSQEIDDLHGLFSEAGL